MTTEQLPPFLKKFYPRTSSFLSGLGLFIVDAITLFVCMAIGFFIVNLIVPHDINFRSVVNYTLYIPLILIVFLAAGLYPGIMTSPTDEVRKFTICSFFSFMGIAFSLIYANILENNFLVEHLITYTQDLPLIVALLLAVPFSAILLPGNREIAKHIFKKFGWWGVPAGIYCSGYSANEILMRLRRNKSLGYKPALIINDAPSYKRTSYLSVPVFAPSQEVENIIRSHNIKVAIICDYKSDIKPIMTAYRYTIRVNKNQMTFTSTQHLKDIGGIIAFASTHNLTFTFNLAVKRFIDIMAVVVCLPILIPVFLILGILTKLTSKGPVFYGHPRVGKNGKEIKAWKFRSMCVNSQEMLEEILANDPKRRAEWEKDRKFTDDPRVTKFGKFLRRSSLDELPQLINILTGEMSLVGPRPVTEGELVKYGDMKDYVLSVKPGLTGMWQISGRSDTGYEDRITFDTYYIQNWSIWLDIWILIKTIWVVLNGKGAY